MPSAGRNIPLGRALDDLVDIAELPPVVCLSLTWYIHHRRSFAARASYGRGRCGGTRVHGLGLYRESCVVQPKRACALQEIHAYTSYLRNIPVVIVSSLMYATAAWSLHAPWHGQRMSRGVLARSRDFTEEAIVEPKLASNSGDNRFLPRTHRQTVYVSFVPVGGVGRS